MKCQLKLLWTFTWTDHNQPNQPKQPTNPFDINTKIEVIQLLKGLLLERVSSNYVSSIQDFQEPVKNHCNKKTYEVLNPHLDATLCSSYKIGKMLIHGSWLLITIFAQPSYCWWRLKSGVNSPVEGTVGLSHSFTGLLAPSQVVLIPGFLKHQQYLVGGFNPVEKY